MIEQNGFATYDSVFHGEAGKGREVPLIDEFGVRKTRPANTFDIFHHILERHQGAYDRKGRFAPPPQRDVDLS